MAEGKVDDFHSIFWREQRKLNAQSTGGHRYHPEVIK